MTFAEVVFEHQLDDSTGLRAAKTVDAYMHALARRDWPATRSRRDLARAAQLAGSCEQGMATV